MDTTNFAILVVVAALAGVIAGWISARRAGKEPVIVVDAGTAALVMGLIVGRIFYIVTPPPSAAPFYTRAWYFSHPLDLLAGPVAIWNGGLGPAGALVGAAIGALIVLREKGVDVWEWADILLPGALTAAILLPWANVLEGQMLGPATSLPWGISAGGQMVQPTPAYVSLWALLVAAGALVARRRGIGAGWAAGTWSAVCWAALLAGLFLADLLRSDASRPLLGLSGMQILCILAEIGLAALLWRRLGTPPGTTADVPKFTQN